MYSTVLLGLSEIRLNLTFCAYLLATTLVLRHMTALFVLHFNTWFICHLLTGLTEKFTRREMAFVLQLSVDLLIKTPN